VALSGGLLRFIHSPPPHTHTHTHARMHTFTHTHTYTHLRSSDRTDLLASSVARRAEERTLFGTDWLRRACSSSSDSSVTWGEGGVACERMCVCMGGALGFEACGRRNDKEAKQVGCRAALAPAHSTGLSDAKGECRGCMQVRHSSDWHRTCRFALCHLKVTWLGGKHSILPMHSCCGPSKAHPSHPPPPIPDPMPQGSPRCSSSPPHPFQTLIHKACLTQQPTPTHPRPQNARLAACSISGLEMQGLLYAAFQAP